MLKVSNSNGDLVFEDDGQVLGGIDRVTVDLSVYTAGEVTLYFTDGNIKTYKGAEFNIDNPHGYSIIGQDQATVVSHCGHILGRIQFLRLVKDVSSTIYRLTLDISETFVKPVEEISCPAN
jgi:hypothetical protein